MLTFKAFLIEEERTQEIDETKALQIMSNHCRAYLERYQEPVMFRGVQRLTRRYAYVEPAKYERESANTSNLYTWLIDIMPSWKNFPKRSKSIVCTTQAHGGKGYGVVYAVVPFDNARIGVCSAGDFWASFDKVREMGSNTMDDFNRSLKIFLDRCARIAARPDEKVEHSATDSKEIFFQSIKVADQIMKNLKKADMLNRITDDIQGYYTPVPEYMVQHWQRPGDIMKLLNALLDPVKNDLDLVGVADIGKYAEASNSSGKNEIWTDSPAVLIRLVTDETGDAWSSKFADNKYDLYTQARNQIMGHQKQRDLFKDNE